VSLLSHAACASMSTTTTTRDRGDRYGPIEWVQKEKKINASKICSTVGRFAERAKIN